MSLRVEKICKQIKGLFTRLQWLISGDPQGKKEHEKEGNWEENKIGNKNI